MSPGKHRVTAVLATLLAFGATASMFLLLNRRFYAAAIGYDEEFFAWGGWCITKGLAPYRDFIEFKPPMVFITHALAQVLFGLDNQRFRIFFAIFPLASVLLLQASLVARGIERFLAMAVVLGIVSLFLGPWHETALSDPESIGLSYYMLGLGLLLWEGREARRVKVTTALGGFFLACCVMSKEPFLPVVVSTWLGLFFLRGRPRPSRASAKLYATYSLIGVAVFAVALFIYMIPTGAMSAYITMVTGYADIYRDPKVGYCSALGLPAPQTLMGQLALAAQKLGPRFLNENVLGYLAPLGIPGAIFAFRRSRKLFVAMVVTFACGVWAATATNCYWPHYLVMSMAGVIFVLVASLDSLKPALAAADSTVRTGASVAAVLWMAAHLGQDLVKQKHFEHQPRQPWQEPAPGLMDVIAKNTTPTDRIFTTGPPILYAQANRLSAIRQSNIIDEILGSYPGTTDEEKLLPIREQLLTNKPKVVFLDPEHGERKARHNRSLMMPFLAEHHYQKVAENVYLRP